MILNLKGLRDFDSKCLEEIRCVYFQELDETVFCLINHEKRQRQNRVVF